MGGQEFFDQAQHVIVTSAEDAVPPHFGGILRGERDRDGLERLGKPRKEFR